MGMRDFLCFFLLTASVAYSSAAPHHARQVMASRFIESHLAAPGNKCIQANCSSQAKACGTEWSCIKAGACNANCALPWHKKDRESCNLLCELSYGYNSTKYRDLMQCMSDHGCLPLTKKSDGICLANDTDTIKNLTSLSQIPGKWWIVRGRNCGQNSDWPAGFDYFPCQRDDFVLENGAWIDHIAYCGATPTGPYAGGSVVSRTGRKPSDIPKYVETIFRAKAKEFKFDYDKMCLSDDSIAACID